MPVNTSYAGTGSSADPSAQRTRGRRTGTRRPPNVTDPASMPCRTPLRSGLYLPLGPHTAVTSASINCCITFSPAPTAKASSPSRRSAATSSIAMLNCSGTAGADASDTDF